MLTDRAAVFADGRYTVQVRAQVDAGQFEILISGRRRRARPGWRRAPTGAVIGYDPRLHSPEALATLKRGGGEGRRDS